MEMMEIPKITRVNIRYLAVEKPRLKAYADITLNDCVLIKNIKIVKTLTRYSIAFPKESKNNVELIVLLNSKVRNYFEYIILTKFFEGRDVSEKDFRQIYSQRE